MATDQPAETPELPDDPSLDSTWSPDSNPDQAPVQETNVSPHPEQTGDTPRTAETPVVATDTEGENRLKRTQRTRATWWISLLLQPLLTVAALVALVFGFGWAQRHGLLETHTEKTTETSAGGEEVLYVCPMACVPASPEPGNCPVCGMELKAQKSSGDAKDKYGLKLNQASIRVANIQTTIAEARPMIRKIRTVGTISYDEGSLATIAAYVDGRIEKLFADYNGVRVDKGDELALLYSPDLYSSQVALLESIKLMKNSRHSNNRISAANQRLYESSRQRLIELGLTEQQVDQLEQDGNADSRIRIVSPIAGTVIEKMVVEGKYVKTGQPLFRVADLSRVWLMLELFPQDAAKICFGQKVLTRIQSLPGKEFVGRVAFISPTVSEKTQTVQVRVVIPNEQGLIRIGDFATASITASANSPADQRLTIYDPEMVGKWISPRHPHIIRDGPGKCPECGMDLVPASKFGFVATPPQGKFDVVVPRTAVLMAGDDSVVYVETEPGRFEYRNVTIGHVSGDEVSLTSGVRAGERVVSGAAVLVDTQFNLAGKPSLIDPARATPQEPAPVDESLSPDQIAAFSGLTKEEREEVIRQRICPVTQMPLGSMGPPQKVTLGDRTLWICCGGCRQKLIASPEKYLTILDKATDKATTPAPELPTMELPRITPFVPEGAPQ